LKFPQIPAENSVIPENSRGNSWSGGFPGIPEREFPVALHWTPWTVGRAGVGRMVQARARSVSHIRESTCHFRCNGQCLLFTL